MKIAIAVLAAVLFYSAVCTSLNIYYDSGILFPKRLIFLDKKSGMIMSASAAALSCAALLAGVGIIPVHRLLLFYLFCIFLAAAAIIDFYERIIPNKVVLIIACIWLIYSIALLIYDVPLGIDSLVSSLSGFVFSLLVFGTGYLLMRSKLGGGDVKLVLVMGLVLTGDVIFGALVYGLGLSLLFALCAIITGKMKIRDTMPFGPFLFLGTAAAIAAYSVL